MQRRLMDILADPDNPDYWPLKLEIFKSEMRKREKLPHPHENGILCKFYCHQQDKFLVIDPLGENEQSLSKDKIDKITVLQNCYECIKEEIIDGILYHIREEKIKWFIIDREIPVMFPIDLRDVKQERKFISNYKADCAKLKINKPKKIL